MNTGINSEASKPPLTQTCINIPLPKQPLSLYEGSTRMCQVFLYSFFIILPFTQILLK